MNSWPNVTVLIPAFNCVDFLTATVQSVLAQDYPGTFAIHILDDGSTDGTPAIIQHLVDHNSRIEAFSQPNAGRAATRDRLLRACPTPLAAWIDSDDIATPTWLRDQVATLQADDGIAAVSGQGYAMTRTGNPIAPLPAHPLTDQAIMDRHLRGLANAFYQSCVVMRRDAAIASGGYRKEFFASEDYDLWLRLAQHGGRLANVDKIHLLYRVHDASANGALSAQQRQQGFELVNEARRQRGMTPLPKPPHATPSPRKDDWNRRIYWINRAMHAGNHRTAAGMASTAVGHHPTSLLLWGIAIVNLLDSVVVGNAVRSMTENDSMDGCVSTDASIVRIGPATRLARWLVRQRRRFRGPCPDSSDELAREDGSVR